VIGMAETQGSGDALEGSRNARSTVLDRATVPDMATVPGRDRSPVEGGDRRPGRSRNRHPEGLWGLKSSLCGARELQQSALPCDSGGQPSRQLAVATLLLLRRLDLLKLCHLPFSSH
jgi:hypothetical protein